ncbi:MAG TPA: ribosome maturation factor RimP [Bryobacteraceae bacterium]|nr:ribosome maturation factor RimP [Bryobacteraceae bacterium]HPT29187.1 ribosome maturation factor RimP [Bryobacteraceae bacterium]
MPETERQNWIEHVTQIAERAAARESMELWAVECAGAGKSRVVRIFIDKPGGVSHADCELISEQVGTMLDVEDAVPGRSYHLEVSSPGVERKLRHAGDFRRYQGEKARVSLREAVDGQKRFEGRIAEVGEDGVITLETGETTSIRFRMDEIEKANLKFDW